MIEDKGLAVSAALDLLAASEILSCFELQEEVDLDLIRACIEKKRAAFVCSCAVDLPW